MLDTAWYLDLGASHHITFYQRNLITGLDYKGTEQVYGGNAQVMKIEHIGSSFIHAFLSNKPLN
ncbi:hypothetical protein AHAS_Ahas18G0166600 [Arachis hypogaea]